MEYGLRLIFCLFLFGSMNCGPKCDRIAADEVNREITGAADLDRYPEMIFEAPPVYPLLAVNSGVEGVVWVRAKVSEKGEVLEAAVSVSSGFSYLDEAALKAAMKCRYRPGLQQGEPVTCWVTYKVDFNLNK